MKDMLEWLQEGPETTLSGHDKEMFDRVSQYLLHVTKDNRKDFYADDFNSERANEAWTQLITKCTLKEILWIMRNIAYDQISYYSAENKGRIYNGSYDEKHIEQAGYLQKDLSTMCDLFGQVIINHRNFDEGYLEERAPSYMMAKMIAMKNKIEELEKRIEND